MRFVKIQRIINEVIIPMSSNKKDKLYEDLYEAMVAELVLAAILFISIAIKDIQKYLLISSVNVSCIMIVCLILMMIILTFIITPIILKFIG